MTPRPPVPLALATRVAGPWAPGRRWVQVRIVLAGALFVGMFGILAHRAFRLQVRDARHLRELAEEQYLKDVELPSRRGRILDRHGNELAASAEVDSVYANPRQIEAAGQAERTAAALGEALHLEPREIERALGGRRYFAWIKRQVQPEEARAVRDLGLLGVALAREPRRYYPNRTLAGTVLGWAGLDGRGLEGVELRWDKELRGAPAAIGGLRDAFGRELLPAGIADAPSTSGRDVVLTIDKFIQYRLEKALEEGVEKNHAKAGVGVALDPRSGEVLAMAAVPTLNPNAPVSGSGARNRAVTDPYEPGSTMKTFSITAAIEAGIVKPEDKWFCENGRFPVGAAVIHDAERIGAATTVEVLAKSSNICTAKIARRSGKERVEDALRRFGFGAPLGIDLPGERGGLLRSSKKWGEIELATISFGQGVTATPLQVVSGYATIANGGTLWRPRVVARIVDERGREVAAPPPEGRRAIAPEVAKTMRAMLHAVTEKGGTGEKLAIPGYPAAGKTGTAQKVDPLTRKYSTEKWASSFVGFAPLDDPRVVILIVVDEPAGTHYGGAVAGPIWREVMADTLRYLGVAPTGSTGPGEVVPLRAAPAPAAVAKAAAPVGAGAAREDAGEVAADVEPDDEHDDPASEGGYLASSDEVVPEGAVEIPDFTGLSMAELIEAARRARLPLEVSGSGRVVGQSPGPGKASAGTLCRVSLAPPG